MITDRRSVRPARTLAALVGLLLTTTLLAIFPASPVSANGLDQGRVRGEILSSKGTVARVKLQWFDTAWNYLGARKVRGGAYSISLAPGTYYLQALDLAPAFDVTKNRPSTVKVTVRVGRTAVKNIRMRRGASIGGTVTAGSKPGRAARVVAANTDQQTFETTADKRGSFALGGLPPGEYSVFTYDRKGAWVGRSVYLPKVRGRGFSRVDIDLPKRAGGLLVDLYAGNRPLRDTVFVTAVSRSTGQFWTARSKRGSVTFSGLFPGRYTVQVPGAGNYLPATVKVKGKVKPRRVAFGSAKLTQRGAWVTGTVVDANRPSQPLSGASVRLLSSSGAVVATTTSGGSGEFTLDGQLLSQKGMSVVAGPGPNSPYLGQGTSYCKYASTTVSGVQVSTGKRTDVGDVALTHLPDEQQDGMQCWTVLDPSSTRGSR